ELGRRRGFAQLRRVTAARGLAAAANALLPRLACDRAAVVAAAVPVRPDTDLRCDAVGPGLRRRAFQRIEEAAIGRTRGARARRPAGGQAAGDDGDRAAA